MQEVIIAGVILVIGYFAILTFVEWVRHEPLTVVKIWNGVRSARPG